MLTINTDLSRSIIARYTHFASGLSSDAQMVLLSGEGGGQTGPDSAPPVLRQTIQNIWHIHRCIEQNTILNVQLGLRFAGRLAGAVSTNAAVQLRGALQTERFVSLTTQGNTVHLQHEHGIPPLLLQASAAQPGSDRNSPPVKGEERQNTPPKLIWQDNHNAQLLTFLERAVRLSGERAPVPPLVEKVAGPAVLKGANAEMILPETERQPPQASAIPQVAPMKTSARYYRVGVVPPNRSLLLDFYSAVSSQVLSQAGNTPLVRPSGINAPQLLLSDTAASTPPANVKDIAYSDKSETNKSKTTAVQTPLSPTNTKSPIARQDAPFVQQPLVHAPAEVSKDIPPAQQRTASPQRASFTLYTPINKEIPYPEPAAAIPATGRVSNIDRPQQRPFPLTGRVLPVQQPEPGTQTGNTPGTPQATALQPIFQAAQLRQGVLPFTVTRRPAETLPVRNVLRPFPAQALQQQGQTGRMPPAPTLNAQDMPPALTPNAQNLPPDGTPAALRHLQRPEGVSSSDAGGVNNRRLPATRSTGKAPAYSPFSPAQTLHRTEAVKAPARGETDESLDIPTVIRDAKNVQSTTVSETVSRNISVNAPQSMMKATAQNASEEETMRDVDREINRLSDEIYRKLEQRFRSEKMRRGMW